VVAKHPRRRRKLWHWLSEKQASITATAGATLLVEVYSQWVNGVWPPQATPVFVGSATIVVLTILFWIMTGGKSQNADPPVTVTGDHPVVAAASGASAVGVQQPAANDGPDSRQ
jgi:hypothetical protein